MITKALQAVHRVRWIDAKKVGSTSCMLWDYDSDFLFVPFLSFPSGFYFYLVDLCYYLCVSCLLLYYISMAGRCEDSDLACLFCAVSKVHFLDPVAGNSSTSMGCSSNALPVNLLVSSSYAFKSRLSSTTQALSDQEPPSQSHIVIVDSGEKRTASES